MNIGQRGISRRGISPPPFNSLTGERFYVTMGIESGWRSHLIKEKREKNEDRGSERFQNLRDRRY